MAPFLSIASTTDNPQDTWGYLKVPFLDKLGLEAGPDGWKQIPVDEELQYTALSGIPFSIPHVSGNTTFQIQTWYWQLDNATLRDHASPSPLMIRPE